ncbi:hypothetical protein KHA80_14510 [Anaerobacillus sp. HL2]|nr:hypothetical protein KHA80_14510 [Anaerobacillus sp. HL2]
MHDYYYQNSGDRIALLGGGWAVGWIAGAFCWYLSNASSYRYRNVGARLLLKNSTFLQLVI